MKASAVVEWFDINRFKVVATLPSQSEAEQQTIFPRTISVEAHAKAFWRYYGCKDYYYFKSRNLVWVNQLLFTYDADTASKWRLGRLFLPRDLRSAVALDAGIPERYITRPLLRV